MTSPNLAAVPQYDPDHQSTYPVTSTVQRGSSAEIPDFEGEAVAATKGKITSVGGLEIGDRTFKMDESVRMVVEARVVGIDHRVNATGKLERVHTLKAIDSAVIDWQMDLDALRAALPT